MGSRSAPGRLSAENGHPSRNRQRYQMTLGQAARIATRRRSTGQGSGRDGAGGIHHAKQRRLDHVRQIPELTACDTGDHRLTAITLSHVQCCWLKSEAWYLRRRSGRGGEEAFAPFCTSSVNAPPTAQPYKILMSYARDGGKLRDSLNEMQSKQGPIVAYGDCCDLRAAPS
jgi:hypothetical protein